ncbi:hypothetical protein SCOCK_60128 [Actinacidiphila cocklensis]|uniref:Uncharacterized protein n=1 Tax=Actinacidiphila cocklensis TaxID=887465 RepID=A0A9W4GUZ8_9ACTN|nr:hypothetical protein SCOCK_60128 [Actinacidiphila cocklensis]
MNLFAVFRLRSPLSGQERGHDALQDDDTDQSLVGLRRVCRPGAQARAGRASQSPRRGRADAGAHGPARRGGPARRRRRVRRRLRLTTPTPITRGRNHDPELAAPRCVP